MEKSRKRRNVIADKINKLVHWKAFFIYSVITTKFTKLDEAFYYVPHDNKIHDHQWFFTQVMAMRVSGTVIFIHYICATHKSSASDIDNNNKLDMKK